MSLERLTKKTVFLVALATAKRISELQALSPEILFQKQNVILYIKHSFLAKTETAFNKLPKAITLHALREMKNTSELNNPLCPVRCLLFYLKKIKSLNINPSSLFVAPKDPSKALSKNAISFFLRDTILKAKVVYNDRGPVKAHDVQGFSASIAFKANI